MVGQLEVVVTPRSRNLAYLAGNPDLLWECLPEGAAHTRIEVADGQGRIRDRPGSTVRFGGGERDRGQGCDRNCPGRHDRERRYRIAWSYGLCFDALRCHAVSSGDAPRLEALVVVLVPVL